MSEIFIFKSRQPFFDKEKYGIKNNTVREIDLEDERFLRLIRFNEEGYDRGELKIQIIDYKRPDNSFTRDIRDISIWKNLMIITWDVDGE